MRTPPAKFLTDLENGSSVFYCLKLISDSHTYYWHTAQETFSLWPNLTSDHGGSALTKDGARLGKTVEGEEVGPISTVETGLNIEEYGSGAGEIGDFTITLLNQDEFSDTINAENFTYRSAELRMGIVDTTNGVGWNDMLIVASYVVENTQPYDWGQYVFTCVDGEVVRDKLIPQTLVTKENYPRAADESFGSPIPMVYGSFAWPSYDETYAVYYRIAQGDGNCVPSVVTNVAGGAFSYFSHTCADHAGGVSYAYYVSGNTLGQIEAFDEVAGAFGTGVLLPDSFAITWFLCPNAVNATYTTEHETLTNQFDYIVDRDLTNIYTADTDEGTYGVYFTITQDYDLEFPASFDYYVRFGTIPSGKTVVVNGAKISDGTPIGVSTPADETDSDSDYYRVNFALTGSAKEYVWGMHPDGPVEIKAFALLVSGTTSKRAVFNENPSGRPIYHAQPIRFPVSPIIFRP